MIKLQYKQSLFLLVFLPFICFAQFPPPAGQPGTTAIHKDSSVFVAWATGCNVIRGWQNIADTLLGYANVGDPTMALGPAGDNGVVSLGDGGVAIVTFEHPIVNGPGWDFAVFENAFSDTFLELAFVEVSSDGMNYYRFPATSLTDTNVQIPTFGQVDATKINNLAGKYRVLYGTPFDLNELASTPGLNVNNITHVKIIDVVGSLLNSYARYDAQGRKINDPWPTPFGSSGFDLDAVGVINNTMTTISPDRKYENFVVYPNPVNDHLYIKTIYPSGYGEARLYDVADNLIFSVPIDHTVNIINTANLSSGFYFLKIIYNKKVITHKIIKI